MIKCHRNGIIAQLSNCDCIGQHDYNRLCQYNAQYTKMMKIGVLTSFSQLLHRYPPF